VKILGRNYKLRPGTYSWFVWPGLGPRSGTEYRPLLGVEEFLPSVASRRASFSADREKAASSFVQESFAPSLVKAAAQPLERADIASAAARPQRP
jgi:hypothetical protein